MSQEYICHNQLKYKKHTPDSRLLGQLIPPSNQLNGKISKNKKVQDGYGYISLALSRSQTVSVYWTVEVGIGTAGVVEVELELVLARFELVLARFDPIVILSSYCGGGASSSLT